MKIFELFKLICPEEFKDIHVQIERVDNIKDLTGKYTMSFCVLNNNEQKLYEESLDRENFVGSSEYLKVYDMEVDEFFNILKDYGELELYNSVMKKLRKYKRMKESYILVTHMILHELGHYNQYLERKRNVYDYVSWCYEEEKLNFEKHQKYIQKVKRRIQQGKLPEWPNKEEQLEAKKIAKEYREIPKEQDADDFAYKHMEEAIKILYKHK